MRELFAACDTRFRHDCKLQIFHIAQLSEGDCIHDSICAPQAAPDIGPSAAIPRIEPAAINLETAPLPALVRPPAPAPLPSLDSVPVASPTPVHDMITAPAQIPSLHRPDAPEVPARVPPVEAPVAPAPAPVVAPVLVAIADVASSPTPHVIEDAITRPASVPALRPPSEPLPPPPSARAMSTSTSPPLDDVDGGWDLGDEDPTAGQAEETSTPSSAEMAGDGAPGSDGLDSVD